MTHERRTPQTPEERLKRFNWLLGFGLLVEGITVLWAVQVAATHPHDRWVLWYGAFMLVYSMPATALAWFFIGRSAGLSRSPSATLT